MDAINILSSNPATAQYNRLLVQGLEYFAKVDRLGNCHGEIGTAPSPAGSANWPAIWQRSERLGELFGLDTLGTVQAANADRQWALSASSDGIQGAITFKRANAVKLLAAASRLN